MLHRNLIWTAVVLGAVVIGLLAWWIYDAGKLRGAAELESLRDEHARLLKQHELVADTNSELLEQVAILERSSQIDRQAAEKVQNELGALQEVLHAARDEIEFYRGIVSHSDGKSGLRIQRFALNAGTQPGKFNYDLVLMQLKNNERYVSGQVGGKIIGRLEGETRELDMAAVAGNGAEQLDFRFRYFQRLTGEIALPDGFQAQEVVLSIKTTGKNAPEPLLEVFEWPDEEP